MLAFVSKRVYFFYAVAINVYPSRLYNALKLLGERLVGIFLFGQTRTCYDRVSVAYYYREIACLVQRLTILRGKGGQLANGRIFFEDDLTVTVCKYFKRVATTDNIDTD